MTFYAKLWCDIIGDEKLMRAARKGARQLELLPWFIAFAKKADDKGRLSVNGEAAEPDDIAAGIPGVTAKRVNEGLQSLKAIGVLVADEDDVLRFAKWDGRQFAGSGSSGRRSGEFGDEPRSREESGCYVYYATDGTAVKIGVSRNPWARVNELKTARPGMRVAAVERGGIDLERSRHEQFKACCIEREWYELTPDLSAHIARLVDAPKAATATTDVATDGGTVVTTENHRSGRSSERSLARARSRDKDLDLDKDLDGDRDRDKHSTSGTGDAAASVAPGNWVARLTEHAQKEIGHVQAGYLGKTLKPYVQREGESVVATAMTYYALDRRTAGKSATFKWFLEDIAQWIDNAKQPLELPDGTITPLGERLYGLSPIGTRR